MANAIDSHQHFWRYDAAEYAWIDDSMAAIRRDFLPPELRQTMEAAGVVETVAVQARTHLGETHWLLDLAREHPFIRAVVGWVPLADDSLPGILEDLLQRPALRGVREVLQGAPPGSLLEDRLHRGIARLAPLGLTYDLLIYSHQLEEAAAFVDRHPSLTIVLDHLAKPRIEGTPDPAWVRGIREMARRPHVFCKVSGMVTEAAPGHATADAMRPYFEIVVEAFGPERLLFGSDWPVLLTRTNYADWWQTVQTWTKNWTALEKEAFFGGNASRIYRLGEKS